MKRHPNPLQRGFSLVELLIAMAIGMIVMAGLTVLFIANLRSSSDMVSSARINQDISAIMTVMVNDLRRAGFANGEAGLYGVDNAPNADLNVLSDSGRHCVLYSYDRNRDAALDEDEFGGFRLNADGSISVRSSCEPTDPEDPDDGCFTLCSGADSGDWERLTDSNVVEITNFTLTTTGSKCMTLLDPDINPADVTTDKTYDYWEVTAAGSQVFPCNATAATGLTYSNFNPATSTYSAGVWAAPVAGEVNLENRQINISITAQLPEDDPDVPEAELVRKTLQSTVNVRNSRIWVVQ